MGPSIGDKQQRAQKIADDLLGTSEALPDEVLEDQDLAEFLDDLIMLCDTCGWWVETSEMDDDQNCEDCQE